MAGKENDKERQTIGPAAASESLVSVDAVDDFIRYRAACTTASEQRKQSGLEYF